MVPPGGPVFGPFILSDVLKLCKLLCAQNAKLKATLTQTASVAGILNCFEALVAKLVVAMMCDADVCGLIPTTRLKRVFEWGVKQAPRRHQIQNAEGPVLDPCAKQMNFRRDPKVDPLGIESGPSWRACFWSLHFVRCAEALQAAMCAKCQA